MNFLKSKLLTIVLVLCLVFTIFVGITANEKGNNGMFQRIVTGTISPVQKYVYMAGQRISNMFYFVSSIAMTRKENIELRNQIVELDSKIIDYDKFKRENTELNSLLGYKNNNSNTNFISANVIGKVGENWFNLLILDVGENQWIKKGEYVVNGQGLVGQVTEVSFNSCKVVTILDNKANIPGKISSNADSGLVIGTDETSTDRLCEINYLPPDTKTHKGDLVLTSNTITDVNNLVQENVLIGTVTAVEEEKTNLIKVAYIKPAVDFSKIEKVMVIKK
jgi:rod shape-determining protein MreC